MIDQRIVGSAALKFHFSAAMLTILAVSGCARSDGPPRYGITGTVKYDGKDAAMADVTFSPDADKGVKGPGVFVKAKDGKFTVDAAHGPAKGAYLVNATFYDGKSTSPRDSMGTKIAGPLQVKVEIPPPKNVLDLSFSPTDAAPVKASETTRRR